MRRFPVIAFFALSYAITAAASAHLLALQGHAPATTWVPHVVAAGPSLAGLLLTLVLYGPSGIRRLAARLAPWSAGLGPC